MVTTVTIKAGPKTDYVKNISVNSRRKIDHSMVDLVLKALESTDAHIRDY